MGFVRVKVSIRPTGHTGKRYETDFLVDTSAMECLVPASELRRIGIKPVASREYELADGSIRRYSFGFAEISFLGEITVGRVLFGDEGSEPLLGMIALESAGFVIDPAQQALRRLPALYLKRAAPIVQAAAR